MMASRYSCPQCESQEIVRMPENENWRLLGYRCDACGLIMRSGSRDLGYWAAIFMCICFIVVGIAMGYAGVVLFGAGIVYSVRQLIRPKPLIVSTTDDD